MSYAQTKKVINLSEMVDGVEIYSNNIMKCADEYIQQRTDGSLKNIREMFPDMIYYIHDALELDIDTDDIDGMDALFNIYVRLCGRCSVLPTVECFSWLIGIMCATIKEWANGVVRADSSRKHGIFAKKWIDTCAASCVNRLSNQTGSNVNLIFVAKAAYGMAETAPVQVQKSEALPVSELPKQLGGVDNVDKLEQKE